MQEQTTTATTAHPNWPLRIILVVSLVFSVICLINLWKHKSNIFAKLLWSVFVFVPLLGPLFYAVIYQPPSLKVVAEHAEETADIEHLN